MRPDDVSFRLTDGSILQATEDLQYDCPATITVFAHNKESSAVIKVANIFCQLVYSDAIVVTYCTKTNV